MKISDKQYALALYESIKDQSKSDTKKAIKEFAKVLVLNNDLLKIDKVIDAFKKLYNQEEGIVKAKVISAQALDKKIVKSLNSYIVKLSKAKKVEVNEEIDKSLLGGVVLRYGDKVLDGSLKTRLDFLGREMKK